MHGSRTTKSNPVAWNGIKSRTFEDKHRTKSKYHFHFPLAAGEK